jgi:hypothetical protein
MDSGKGGCLGFGPTGRGVPVSWRMCIAQHHPRDTDVQEALKRCWLMPPPIFGAMLFCAVLPLSDIMLCCAVLCCAAPLYRTMRSVSCPVSSKTHYQATLPLSSKACCAVPPICLTSCCAVLCPPPPPTHHRTMRSVCCPASSKRHYQVTLPLSLRACCAVPPIFLTSCCAVLCCALLQDYAERVLPSIIQETLKSVVAQYNASQLLTMREVGDRMWQLFGRLNRALIRQICM